MENPPRVSLLRCNAFSTNAFCTPWELVTGAAQQMLSQQNQHEEVGGGQASSFVLQETASSVCRVSENNDQALTPHCP